MNYYFVRETPIGELLLEVNLKYLIKISFNGKYTNRINTSSFNRKILILEKTVEQLDEYFFIIEDFLELTIFLIPHGSLKKYSKKFLL